jgi:carbon-monoxide dehydrogenase large subunit
MPEGTIAEQGGEMPRFGVGQPVPRKEDPTLLRGQGRYTDDINLPGQLHAVIVRSRIAHGVLRALDTADAASMPGVRGVFAGADLLAAGFGAMPTGILIRNRDGSPMHRPKQPPLTVDKVRFVGDPIAFVVADTAHQARDAAEMVVPDIDPLPSVTDAEAAAASGAPRVHDAVAGNVVVDFEHGDLGAVRDAFSRAAHVTRLSICNNRVVVSALEPRAAIGDYDALEERWTLRLGCQGVFGMREGLKTVLGVPVEKIRVLTGNVGGSFGMKASVYPEYICVLYASRVLGLPVKWRDDRSDSFLSDSHGRNHDRTVEGGFDAGGRILALRIGGVANLGAYLSNATGLPPTGNTVKNSIGVYRIPAQEVTTRCVFTNTTPVGPYRGAGRPEGNYYIERLLDTAAREMGIDPVAIRRINHIRADEMPFRTVAGTEYDSGDFPAVLERALALADWDGFAARAEESRARGRLRGRGIGQYLEVTAPSASEMGGIRFEPDGHVTIITGTLDYGQGHASPFAQVLARQLGVPFERIQLLQGDSDELIAGGGTGGSKSLMASGGAIVESSAIVIEKGRKVAGYLLEAATADIEFADGVFRIAGTDRGIGIMEIAETLRDGIDLPGDVPRSLDVAHIHKHAPSAYPNGCHVCEVEIDPETGVTEVVRYAMVNDFGVVVNPMLVEGQAHGGIVQGIGQALKETVAYDGDGQLLTGSFMDYALPRATDAPLPAHASHPVPAKTNALGVKGCGEAGCAGALPSVMNAIVDALSVYGIRHVDMPATPRRIWELLRASQAAAD